MKTLGMLLTSTGQTELLRALMSQPGPVSLRQVARIAGIYPHAAELALAPLESRRLVKKRKTSACSLYEVNRDHADALVLDSVFTAATYGFITARSRLLHKRAQSILPFIEEANRMITTARESRHVT